MVIVMMMMKSCMQLTLGVDKRYFLPCSIRIYAAVTPNWHDDDDENSVEEDDRDKGSDTATDGYDKCGGDVDNDGCVGDVDNDNDKDYDGDDDGHDNKDDNYTDEDHDSNNNDVDDSYDDDDDDGNHNKDDYYADEEYDSNNNDGDDTLSSIFGSAPMHNNSSATIHFLLTQAINRASLPFYHTHDVQHQQYIYYTYHDHYQCYPNHHHTTNTSVNINFSITYTNIIINIIIKPAMTINVHAVDRSCTNLISSMDIRAFIYQCLHHINTW